MLCATYVYDNVDVKEQYISLYRALPARDRKNCKLKILLFNKLSNNLWINVEQRIDSNIF